MRKIRIIYRWIKMLFGKSQFHVPQGTGKYYSTNEISGYYSDLRHKVNKDVLLDNNGVPYNITSENKKIYFPITIFQYGLGLYDLFIESKDKKKLDEFLIIANWAHNNIDCNGGWNTFEWSNSINKYSSMAQGEGISLLMRAYVITNNSDFLDTINKAIGLMIRSTDQGGTTMYIDQESVSFEETSDSKSILNGHIFSLWGLYDYLLVFKDEELNSLFNKGLNFLYKNIHRYDSKYWSLYDLSGNIASPFYHDLHINQLIVIYNITSNLSIKEYINKWKIYQKSKLKKARALMMKSLQKLKQLNNEIALIK